MIMIMSRMNFSIARLQLQLSQCDVNFFNFCPQVVHEQQGVRTPQELVNAWSLESTEPLAIAILEDTGVRELLTNLGALVCPCREIKAALQCSSALPLGALIATQGGVV